MLNAGTRVGPYEIINALGAGGMGEVYRARDPRIGREVAIKVLPASFSHDTDRLRRFEQEVRAVGALNHPNILTIFDVGTHDDSPYVVSELLEGKTLREHLAEGALPQRKALEYAGQIARGLAAAHHKGIAHRDLKPENLFVTRDGRLKILDFGLAKLTRPEQPAVGEAAATQSAVTDPGTVLGTVGYMAPEQVRGQPSDHRVDLFAFGAILYEMLAGQRAFWRDSAMDTLSAILKEDPPDLSITNRALSPALERLVRHCLEKNPEERFQSAHDLAFDLESPSGSGIQAAVAAPVRPSRRRWLAIGATLAPLAMLGVGLFLGQRLGRKPPPTLQQLTFRRGTIRSARFAPDGQTIVYSARWETNPVELFSTRPESPESRSLGNLDAQILAISSSGEMAVQLQPRYLGGFRTAGTLARAPLAGGAPRDVLEGVEYADWAPSGNALAVCRAVSGRMRIEFPIGKVLYETAGWISHLRVSPKGDMVAFVDHPMQGDDGGEVAVLDVNGSKRTLATGFASAQGLAWSANGKEIWFTATRAGGARALHAVSLDGQERLLLRVTGALTLHDVARDGRVLMTEETIRMSMQALAPGETQERDLSWLDWSLVRDISHDGKMVLFAETGEGGGANYGVYIRPTDGSPAVKIGEGSAYGLSGDGKLAMALMHRLAQPQIMLYPTGSGEPRPLERGEIRYQGASWFPDGKRIVIAGNEPGRAVRLYVQDLSGGKPKPITPEGISTLRLPVSPDSRFVVGRSAEGTLFLYPVEGGDPRPLPNVVPGEDALGWTADGRSLYLMRRGEMPASVFRLELATGRRELWKQFMPADRTGVEAITSVRMALDGKAYAYSYSRDLSDLYLVGGL